MTGKKTGRFLLALAVLGMLAGGCVRSQPAETGQAAETAAPSETKALAPGEGVQGARVEFVTREHKMERVLFSGGYLRSLPEEKPETILRPAPAGATPPSPCTRASAHRTITPARWTVSPLTHGLLSARARPRPSR